MTKGRTVWAPRFRYLLKPSTACVPAVRKAIAQSHPVLSQPLPHASHSSLCPNVNHISIPSLTSLPPSLQLPSLDHSPVSRVVYRSAYWTACTIRFVWCGGTSDRVVHSATIDGVLGGHLHGEALVLVVYTQYNKSLIANHVCCVCSVQMYTSKTRRAVLPAVSHIGVSLNRGGAVDQCLAVCGGVYGHV